jgi:hypothetical protein
MIISWATRGIVALRQSLGLYQNEGELIDVRLMLLGKLQIFIAFGFVEPACLACREVEDQMERAQRVC